MVAKTFAYIYIILSVSISAYAQNWNWVLGKVNIPASTLYSVYKDSKGYLWIGTNSGLLRYNGLDFHRYTVTDGLPTDMVFFVKEDYKERLWIASNSNQIYYLKNNKITNDSLTTSINKIFSYSNSYPIALHIEQDGSITIGLSEYKYFINISKTDSIVTLPFNLLPFCNSQNDYVLINKISDEKYTFFLSLITLNYTLKNNSISTIDTSKNKNKYILSVNHRGNEKFLLSINGLYSVNENPLLLFSIVPKIKHFANVVHKINENYFICTKNGFKINDSKVIKQEVAFSGCAQDIDKNVWFSSLDSGMYFLPHTRYSMLEWAHPIQQIIKIKDGFGIYKASKNQINITDSNFKIKRTINLHDWGIWDKDIITYSKNNKLYILSNNVLLTYNTNNYDIQQFKLDNIPEVINKIKYIETNNDTIYLISKNQIYLATLDYNKKRVVPASINLPPSIRIRNYSFHNSVFYISSNLGIYPTTPDNKLHNINEYESIKQLIVKDRYRIRLSKYNALYIDFPNKSDTFQFRNIADKIWELGTDYYLIATESDIYLLYIADIYPTPISSLIPLNNRSIINKIEQAFVTNKDLLICSNNQLYKIEDIDKLFHKTYKPHIHIENITSWDSVWDMNLSELNIAYEEAHNISIKLDVLNFSSNEKTYPHYRINNDKQGIWLPVPNKEIHIENLRPGSNFVEIIAYTDCNIRSDVYSIHIHVGTPVWQKTWFLISVSLIGIILIIYTTYILFRYRTKKVIERAHFQKQELIALNALMNPHFTFNSLNTIQYFINNNDPQNANKYIQIFSKLLRQNLTNLQMERILLSDEICLIQNYLEIEKLRFNHSFAYIINIENSDTVLQCLTPPLLLQPIVENAIKHGFKNYDSDIEKTIVISITKQQKHIKVQITDNGCGFQQIKTHSYALKNFTKRIKQIKTIYKQDITIDIQSKTEYPSSTTVIILIEITDC